MKNNDLQELKPVYINQADYESDDQINLIDLALILVRRKTMIVGIFIFTVVLGIISSIILPQKYTFSTSLEIGSQIINGLVNPFESPETLLAKLQHSFIPKALNEHYKSSPDDSNKYKIKAKVPKDSSIIVLEIKGAEGKAEVLSHLLQNITQKAIIDHNRIYESVKRNLLSRLEQSNAKLEGLGSGADNRAQKANLQSSIEGYSAQLVNLRNTREILPPMKSNEPSGLSQKIILALAIAGGAFISIFMAFFAEFIVLVRERGNDSQ